MEVEFQISDFWENRKPENLKEKANKNQQQPT